MEKIRQDEAEKPDWDNYSQTGSQAKKLDAEQKLASKLAEQVLEEYPVSQSHHFRI